jgi:Uncharacterized protein conserved in bacteria
MSADKIRGTLAEGPPLFSIEEATALFEEMGVLFTGQIKKSFKNLLIFRKAITVERNEYLQKDLEEIENRLKVIDEELRCSERERRRAISFLKEEDVFDKYKKLSTNLSEIEASLIDLKTKKERYIAYKSSRKRPKN